MIVYGMTWSLAVAGTDEVLRPLANIAFLLGVAVFVPAAAVLSAVIISLTFLVVCRRKFETRGAPQRWDLSLRSRSLCWRFMDCARLGFATYLLQRSPPSRRATTFSCRK